MEAKFIFIYGALFAQCRLQAEAKSDATKKKYKGGYYQETQLLERPESDKRDHRFSPTLLRTNQNESHKIL